MGRRDTWGLTGKAGMIRAALVVLLVACAYASADSDVLSLDDMVQIDPVDAAAPVEAPTSVPAAAPVEANAAVEATQKKESHCFACMSAGLDGMKNAYASCSSGSSGSCDAAKKEGFAQALTKVKREMIKAESFGELLRPNNRSALMKDMSDGLKQLSELDVEFLTCASNQSKCNKDTFNTKALKLSTYHKPTPSEESAMALMILRASKSRGRKSLRDLGESGLDSTFANKCV